MQGHTTLTPQLNRLFTNGSNATSQTDVLRSLIQDALSKGVFTTACYISEKLMRQPDVNSADIVLFARTYFNNGEPRRCLAVLEHKGLLSAQCINDLSLALSPRAPSSSNKTVTILHDLQNILSAIHLAAQCLFNLEQHGDCIHLLEPIIFFDRNDKTIESTAVDRARTHFGSSSPMQLNLMASIYSIVGRCFDLLDNGQHAIYAFTMAIRIDPACIDVVDYITLNGLLSKADKASLFYDVLNLSAGQDWLEGYYRFQLLDDISLSDFGDDSCVASSTEIGSGIESSPSAVTLVRRAEYLFDMQCSTDAYRLARQAYTLDPFDSRGLMIYIATMVELGLKTELFYLGHELANNYPKLAISWYAVGCYYFICKKLEMAQKYLQKATKLNKRFSKAWIALGHVLAAQEESEHAISAFRSASRLLPGDHRPLVFMAKELVRTSYLSLALHILTAALQLSPRNADIVNEIGVIYLKQEKLEMALEQFSSAISLLKSDEQRRSDALSSRSTSDGCAEEVYSNYATALRLCKRFDEALHWYQLCLAFKPSDAGTFANIAFTLHLSQNFDEAISAYHKALALQPNFTFCSEMLARAMVDSITYGHTDLLEIMASNNPASMISLQYDSQNHSTSFSQNSFSQVDGLALNSTEGSSEL